MTKQRKPQQQQGSPQPLSSGPPRTISRLVGDSSYRRPLIDAIEKRRQSRVLVYVTVDRPDAGAKMGTDVVPIFYEHLEQFGHQPRIDLFLYTKGGFTLAPNRLAFLLREYCDELCVLVPRYAQSAGTTLALAANEIVMHRMGELGPIDPSVANEFNPSDPADPQSGRRIAVSVEDVTAYLALAREQAGVPESEMGEVFDRLAEGIHPLALGNVHRQYLLIRSMAQRLLESHMDPQADEQRIGHILDVLTEKLYFHGYPISRAEAAQYVGLNVTLAEPDLEAEMWNLHTAYEADLLPGQALLPPDPSALAGRTKVEADSAVIESTHAVHTYRYAGAADVVSVKGGSKEIQVALKGDWGLRT